MRIYKFGGASVKNADGVKNLAHVLQTTGYSSTLVVVSAMGKTTNAMELVIANYFNNKSQLATAITEVANFHYTIINHLFRTKSHPVYSKIQLFLNELQQFLNSNKSPNYNYVYDQVIGYGELMSTTIISQYLNSIGIKNTWIDVRQYIKTDNYYRNANINWQQTQNNITTNLDPETLYITQGFLGSDANNFTTSLGREGSDYTAAIFGYCLNATSVTIWKDVPGVLNADPRYFKNTKLLHNISYTEAIELAFYGASVIHPKTLQPLQRKEIPLYVKSFLNPTENGTCVNKGDAKQPQVPCFILKQNQVLLSLSALDFSYIVEHNISHIFKLLADYKMKVDVIQNSAISFSVCFDDLYHNLNDLLQELKATFKVTCYQNVNLYTIRHYNTTVVQDIEKNKTVLMKQLTQNTVQIVTK